MKRTVEETHGRNITENHLYGEGKEERLFVFVVPRFRVLRVKYTNNTPFINGTFKYYGSIVPLGYLYTIIMKPSTRNGTVFVFSLAERLNP